jgi:hypothetical protein
VNQRITSSLLEAVIVNPSECLAAIRKKKGLSHDLEVPQNFDISDRVSQ